jgi:hypothetical protein
MADTWNYTESKDEMRGTVTKIATNISVNTVNFNFPYQGDQHGTLELFDKTAAFYVKQGQISCNGGSEYGTCIVLVKFDNNKAIYENARKLGDDSTTIEFTNPSFLKRLRKSKKIAIQFEVYRNGYPVFNFDVEGLNQK